ncbi:MAG: response regulator [Candidatus Omnitrophota bacterium]|jgi:DNA-binding NtrC family response regulator
MKKAKILVVDDEKEICEVTRSFLSKKNYLCSVAVCEAEAMAILNKEHPDLVLLDIRLKETSGLDVLRKIKEIDPKIKVVMVTGLADEESVRQAKAQGADDFVSKPFTADCLQELVAQKLSV